MNDQLQLINPDWPAPSSVRAFTTTRIGGVSKGCYDSLNLAMHVGDEKDSVLQNRRRIIDLGLPTEPLWLSQTHSTRVIEHIANPKLNNIEADGSYTYKSGCVCAVMTADCLPILLASQDGGFVSALHAGWRGLADGIIDRSLRSVSRCHSLIAWIGPGISQAAFEVGGEIRELFCKSDPEMQQAFEQQGDRFHADLSQIAKIKLERLGVKTYQSQLCSHQHKELFFSYRRDGITGRMASLIWIDK